MNAVRVGLYYGSTTGNTRRAATRLAALLEADGWADVELLDVADYYLEDMPEFDLLILGVPTWNGGQMQRDWQAVFDEFDEVALDGRLAALFGLGDQVGYPATFADALAFFADKLCERGAQCIGAWPCAGYTFAGSWALGADGRFVGLILDEENQPELTEPRLRDWAEQVRRETAALLAQSHD